MKWVLGKREGYKDFDFIDKMGEDVCGGKSRRRQILGRMSNMSQSTVVAHRPYDHHGTS